MRESAQVARLILEKEKNTGKRIYKGDDMASGIKFDQAKNKGLSRDFVVRSLLGVLDDVEKRNGWGSVSINFQNGRITFMKKEGSVSSENQNMI
jgi:hypothetical protein